MEEAYSVTIFTIATSNYIKFFLELLRDIENFVNPGQKVQIIVLTDYRSKIQTRSKRIRLNKIYHEHKQWPNITLFRYSDILQNAHLIQSDTFIWCDADMRIEKKLVTGDVLAASHLLLSPHPSFNMNLNTIKSRTIAASLRLAIKYIHLLIQNIFMQNSWEKNRKSTAWVPRWKRRRYVQGGFWIGKTSAIIQMCDELSSNIKSDEEFGVIAKWHDESLLNWYASKYRVQHLPIGFVGVKEYFWHDASSRFLNCVNKETN